MNNGPYRSVKFVEHMPQWAKRTILILSVLLVSGPLAFFTGFYVAPETVPAECPDCKCPKQKECKGDQALSGDRRDCYEMCGGNQFAVKSFKDGHYSDNGLFECVCNE